MSRAVLALTLCVAGCNVVSGSGSSSGLGEQTGCIQPDYGINAGPLPEGCGKIEGSEIGTATSIVAGEITIEITGWILKDGDSGEYIGFTYTAPEGTVFSIKAGNEVFLEDGDGTWTHPAGTLGPDASAISNVVVCEGERTEEEMEPEMPPEMPPEDGMEGGGCPDPGDETCTSNEDCASGICQDGICVSI